MPPQRNSHGRRPLLKAIGATSALPLLGSVATAGGDHEDNHGNDGDHGGDDGEGRPLDDVRIPVVHSHFGYAGTSDDEVPERLTPDETVELHADEEKIDASDPTAITVEFGAFHFSPVGLQVDPGAIVKFDFLTPEHTVTAYHPDQGRQRRVPGGVAAFSSPVVEAGGFWLYRFEEPGVYDLFCTPHEFAGMGMRVVVGDSTDDVVLAPGRPPFPLTAALLGTGFPPSKPDTGQPKLDPEYVADNGPIVVGDEPDADVIALDLAVTISGPTPTTPQ